MNAGKRLVFSALAVICALGAALPAGAEVTPMDAELKEEAETLIECLCAGKEKEPWKSLGELMNDKGPSDFKKPYHYRLYIPKGYHADKEAYYPCMFVASPGGQAQMQQMAGRVKREPWIVVMLVESINDSSESHPNFLSAHDDVMKRARVAKGLKFATGLSGGARCASLFPLIRPGFRGLICQAAGMAVDAQQSGKFGPELLVSGTFGTNDFNLSEGQNLRRDIRQCSVRVNVFNGDHVWAPQEAFDDILDWMEDDIFVAAAAKGKPASASQPPGGKPEPTGPEAYRWYISKRLRELEAEQKIFGKYCIVRAILAAVKKGKLDGDKTLKDKIKEIQPLLATLAKDAEVVEGLKSEQLYQKAEKAEAELLVLMRRTGSIYKNVEFKQDERAAMRKCVSALQAVSEKFPDSPYGAIAKLRVESYTQEMDKSAPSDKAGKGKKKN